MVCNVILNITDFAGRFHPLLVHLPVGILLLAALLWLFSPREKRKTLQPAIRIMLFWGMISAAASCISGFILSKSGDYEAALVGKHQWFGISLAIAALVAWYLIKQQHRRLNIAMVLLIILLGITGHLGGSITHGANYLTEPFAGNDAPSKGLQPLPNVQEAVAYNDIVKPILSAKCYSCHGPNKQKGKLRLDDPQYILKGGKEGKTMVAGKADESVMIERLLLPLNHEDHMPPKEKPQLTKDEINLLHWWVTAGGDFNKKVKELIATDKIKPVLASLQAGAAKAAANIADIPEKEVKKADENILRKLKDRGVVIVPVAANSNYLSANFVTVGNITPADLQLLEQIREQLVWLKLSDAHVNDAALQSITKLTALTRLYLDNNPVTDAGISQLSPLMTLQYINLSNTKVTPKGILSLKNNKNLARVYLYQSSIIPADYSTLKKTFPKTIIDTGGYIVPTFATDTTLVQPPQHK